MLPLIKLLGQILRLLLRKLRKNSIETLKDGELMSIKGVTGEADLTDVVAAVNSAEATLQLVTTLRDRMIQAYQEIIRMPI
jgi:flagellar hook-basal body complex protein FliE